MIWREHRFRLQVLLILVGFSISPLVYFQLRDTPKAEVPNPPAGAAIAELPPLVIFKMPPAETFDAILERPIFSPERRPVPEPEEAEKPKIITSSVPLAVTLKGTIVDGPERTAILFDQRKKSIISLKESGQFQSWTLSHIGPEEVTFTRDGVEQHLMLKFGLKPAGTR